MIIKLSAFGYEKLSNLDGVKKALANTPVKLTDITNKSSKIIPLADKLKASMAKSV
jgi:hypothetical protein